jgi:hypothetical protein
MPFSTIASTITVAEVLIPSAIAILAAAIVAWESTRRAHSVGSAKVLRFPAWTRLVVLALVFTAGLPIWLKFKGSEVQQQQSPATIAGFSAAFLAVAILMAMFFRATVRIDDTGLHARPAFRKPLSIAWDEIAEVRTHGDIITIIGLAGTRIRIVTMMIGVRDLRAELAARRPDKLPPAAPRST